MDVMDIDAVKHDIKTKNPKHFYVFSGEEVKVMDIYIDKIAECMGVKPTRADSVVSILRNLSSTSLFSVPKCYVIRNDSDFLEHSEIWQDFFDEKIQNENIVILAFYSLDKRTKFYKTYSNSIVYFERLNERILSKYLVKEIDLSERNINILMEVCEYDYARCLLEIDKINNYAVATKEESKNLVFERLLKNGTIFEPPYDAIFDFVDAVLKRNNVDKIFNLYQQAVDIGEASLTLLSVLYTNAKAVLQVQSCPSDDIANVTGLTGFQIKCAKSRLGRYKNRELVDMMKLIQSVERGIKTGEIEDSVAVNYVLVNCL